MRSWVQSHFWLALGVGVAVGIIGTATGWLPLDRAARGLIQPVGRVFNSLGAGLGGWLEEVGDLGNYKEQNQQLEAKVADLERQISQLTEVELENQELRSQLNFKALAGWQEVGAQVITYSAAGSRQLIRVDRGKQDGIAKGQAVLAGGQLVGVVSEVTGRTAEVILSTDAAFRALVVSQEHRSSGLVSGLPPSGLQLERVPQGQQLDQGESVITSGLDGAFPPGLRLGEVVSVSQTPGSIFQQAHLKPPSSLSRLRVVGILVSQ